MEREDISGSMVERERGGGLLGQTSGGGIRDPMGGIYFVFITGLLPVCSGNRVVATTVTNRWPSSLRVTQSKSSGVPKALKEW